MNPFTFIQVKDAGTAIAESLKSDQSKFVAGGTNLIDLMKFKIEKPSAVIDINALAMQTVQEMPGGALRIGAMVRNSDLAYNTLVSERYPMLSAALLSGASPQLRNMATVGGNLMQRTRCPYFYDVVFPCNKRQPGSGCSAMQGYNRSNAILGTSDKCIATHPSDMCVALAALDAVIHVQGNNGERTIPIADFHLLPGNTPEKEHALQKGELITSVEIPPLPFASTSVYNKVRDRSSFEFALVSVAAAINISGGLVTEARLALGGVGTKPWRATQAEALLKGKVGNEASFNDAADAALKDSVTHKFNAFKVELAKRTIIKTLKSAGGIV